MEDQNQMLSIPTMDERLKQGTRLPEQLMSNALVVRREITILSGLEDSFKTTIACQAAVCLAAGIPCLGFSCQQCNTVVYLVIEGTDDYILERMENMAHALGVPLDVISKRIRVSPYYLRPLGEPEVLNELIGTLADIRPDVIICDPVTYSLTGDLRYSPVMQALGKNLAAVARRFNAAVVGVMHTRKGTQDNDNMDDIMGSSVLADIAACRIKVYRSGDTLNLYAHTRYGPRPDPVKLIYTNPLFVVSDEIRKPRDKARLGVIQELRDRSPRVLGELVRQVTIGTNANEKTVRAAISDLEVELKVFVIRSPGSAVKQVHLRPGL